ncbi:hypothetical protein [Kordia sp.]|uniref:hypothetical protein n=1 Tax=Kordia sp. TaxID=1965332 RepID=UPI0025BAFFED|nr:hypothetical protein [Kordia sp.]MCH2195408.1 hypothetical protein [Kordia sp.]
MKILLKLLFVICLVSCVSTKNDIVVNPSLTKNLKIAKSDLQIITPDIELSEKKNSKFLKHPAKREELRKLVLQTIQSKFPDAPYVEVPFLYKGSYTINSVLETELNYKTKKAPAEILTTGKRYSILISTNCYFGDVERGVINLVLIDNQKKTRKTLEHYRYKHSPLETEKFKRKILKVLDQL